MDFQDLENNLYLIHFEHITDMKRIMEDGPWSFDRDLVLLKKMAGDEQPSKIVLDKVPFWIRLVNLPLNRRNEVAVRAIASRLGEVIDIDVDRLKGGSRHIRARVIIDVTRPICRFVHVRGGHNENIKIDFRFEKLPNFCYWCGLIGHTVRECLVKPESIDNKKQEVWPFMGNLRASPLKYGFPSQGFFPTHEAGANKSCTRGQPNGDKSVNRKLFIVEGGTSTRKETIESDESRMSISMIEDRQRGGPMEPAVARNPEVCNNVSNFKHMGDNIAHIG